MATLKQGEGLVAVEAALRTWDPIGVLAGPISTNAPLDEYDSYAPALLDLLRADASEEDLAAHLAQVRFEIIGVGPEQVVEPELDLAKSLCAWRRRGYPNEWGWELAADGT